MQTKMKTTIRLISGKTIVVAAREFTYPLEGVDYTFAVHRAPDYKCLGVTSLPSGKRVTLVNTHCRVLYGADEPAARRALDELVNRVGAGKVRAVIDGATDTYIDAF